MKSVLGCSPLVLEDRRRKWKELGAARKDEDFPAAGMMSSMGYRGRPADSEAMAKPSHGLGGTMEIGWKHKQNS